MAVTEGSLFFLISWFFNNRTESMVFAKVLLPPPELQELY